MPGNRPTSRFKSFLLGSGLSLVLILGSLLALSTLTRQAHKPNRSPESQYTTARMQYLDALRGLERSRDRGDIPEDEWALVIRPVIDNADQLLAAYQVEVKQGGDITDDAKDSLEDTLGRLERLDRNYDTGDDLIGGDVR